MTDEDKYYGYAPVLSKRFPDFAGLCTKQDFWRECFRQVLWAILYFVAFNLIAGFFLSLSSASDSTLISFIISLALAILLLFVWCKHVGKPYAIVIAQRLHAHGKSCTHWFLIPNVMYYADCIIRVCVGCVGEVPEVIITFGVVIDLIFLVYDLYIWLLCGFISGRYEAKIAHSTNFAANLVAKSMSSAKKKALPTLSKQPVSLKKKVKTTSTAKSILPKKPTPPTPPTV